MKYVLGTVSVIVFLALAMVGWSVAGRFMTANDDVSVAIGIVIVGTILGLMAAAVAFLIRRIAKTVSGTASLDTTQDKKQ